MEKEKCLTSKAMDECNCKWCKMNRMFRDIAIKHIITKEAEKIIKQKIEGKK